MTQISTMSSTASTIGTNRSQPAEMDDGSKVMICISIGMACCFLIIATIIAVVASASGHNTAIAHDDAQESNATDHVTSSEETHTTVNDISKIETPKRENTASESRRTKMPSRTTKTDLTSTSHIITSSKQTSINATNHTETNNVLSSSSLTTNVLSSTNILSETIIDNTRQTNTDAYNESTINNGSTSSTI